MTTAYPTNPMALLGKTFDFLESTNIGDFSYQARVLAVQVPCPGTEIEWAVLLEHQSKLPRHYEYVDLDVLSFDWSRALV